MTKISMDKKYKTNDGRSATILTVTRNPASYPVVALIPNKQMDLDEVHILTDTGAYHHNGKPILLEIDPYYDFRIDDRVLVWNGDNRHLMAKRYFAGVNHMGKPVVFIDGSTSWSSNGATIVYDHCIAVKYDNCVLSRS